MSAAIVHEPLTRSVEDYLKAIYRISLKGEPATTSEIAEHLELAPPSVSGMIKRLSELGLLEHEPYRGVQLTAEGRRLALRMVRRHRILEAYLVGFLGYGWELVHEEAERLEHAVSDVLIERMAAALGDPHFDPHGDPIPAADGSIAELVYTPLTEIPIGETVEIRQADTSHPDRLRYIASFGLTPGARATIEDRQPFHGPVTVRVQGARHVLGDEIARLLLCARPELGQ
ncbi:MAG TPA: metal-dependent transcriptional regulator [Gemmatimonadales bacterium]|jgi:DtxR family Mn-dependent transcriptional regulator|nr:metal-dependent transcriptional regulator [Gemmatimonadales bacterium]